ncbi:hypothetical protein PIB30_088462 [Stylosanthes scabra]|uniref:Uncharacterized protein n=1 Tax=Stylosanthes scabra TaxID=79078 RepID=A0ABU6RUE3_9FABA|nr:hypothetical protein [Stylosanthes scabra]
MARVILIHFIIRGEEVRAEEIIADNMVVIAQGLRGKGNLSFPSTIYKLCKDAGIPLREFRRTSKIPDEKLITAKRMESTRIPRNLPQQQQEDDDEDEQMPQAGEGNEEKEEQQQYQNFQQPPHFYENMQKSQAKYMEEVKQIKAKQEEMWKNTNTLQKMLLLLGELPAKFSLVLAVFSVRGNYRRIFSPGKTGAGNTLPADFSAGIRFWVTN